MNRITIYDTDDESGERYRVGHFDLDAAEHILEEDTRWNGQNMVGKLSGMQTNRAQLYRTAGGRWVEHADHSLEFNGPNIWRFLTDEQARDWMLKSGGSDAEKALETWFPDTPDESGPGPQGGRPKIGPAINVAYQPDLLKRIDAAARRAGMPRAEWLRQVAEQAVTDSEKQATENL